MKIYVNVVNKYSIVQNAVITTISDHKKQAKYGYDYIPAEMLKDRLLN